MLKKLIIRMMFKKSCFLIIVLLGCKTLEPQLDKSSISYDVVQIAIKDFVSSQSPALKEDSVFEITGYSNDKMTILSFYAPDNKYIILKNKENKIEFPTNYSELNGKIFFYHSSDSELQSDVVFKLNEYNQIDTIGLEDNYTTIINEEKNGVNYYFCNNDLTHFEKVETNLAIGSYDPPKLNCN